MAEKKDVPGKPDTVKGLNIVLEALKKSGYKPASKKVKAIEDLLKKQK